MNLEGITRIGPPGRNDSCFSSIFTRKLFDF
jgi:hypothetical protein